jgi:hypothetical protein
MMRPFATTSGPSTSSLISCWYAWRYAPLDFLRCYAGPISVLQLILSFSLLLIVMTSVLFATVTLTRPSDNFDAIPLGTGRGDRHYYFHVCLNAQLIRPTERATENSPELGAGHTPKAESSATPSAAAKLIVGVLVGFAILRRTRPRRRAPQAIQE